MPSHTDATRHRTTQFYFCSKTTPLARSAKFCAAGSFGKPRPERWSQTQDCPRFLLSPKTQIMSENTPCFTPKAPKLLSGFHLNLLFFALWTYAPQVVGGFQGGSRERRCTLGHWALCRNAPTDQHVWTVALPRFRSPQVGLQAGLADGPKKNGWGSTPQHQNNNPPVSGNIRCWLKSN